MTREEREAAIAYIKGYRKLDEDLHNTAPKNSVSYYATDKCLKYWDMSIKALEQEPILDKIRAEIEEKYGNCDICEYFEDYDYEENDISEYRPIGNIVDVLQIIDKYKTESEVEE